MVHELETVNIMVMGAAQSGKSKFIEVVSGIPPQADVVPGIRVSKPFRLDEKIITLYEMPGFDNYVETEGGNLKLIVDFLVAFHNVGRKLHGIIFIHRITDYRTGTISRNYGPILKKLCGEDYLKNIVIVTNRWSDVTEDIGKSREYELSRRDYFFKPLLENGAQMVRHDNTLASTYVIIREVASFRPSTMRVQQEMADRRKHLGQAAVGKHLRKELEGEMKKRREELVNIEERREVLSERKDKKYDGQIQDLTDLLSEEHEHMDRMKRIMEELGKEHVADEDHASLRRLVEVAEAKALQMHRLHERPEEKKMDTQLEGITIAKRGSLKGRRGLVPGVANALNQLRK